MFSKLALTGKTRNHIQQYTNPSFAAHTEVAKAYFALAKKAEANGIKAVPFSSFRDYETQVRIWQYKSQGKCPIILNDNTILDITKASEEEIIHGILRWSMLPGASRHHWGTELDLVDAGAIEKGYSVSLIQEEYAKGGVFYELGQFLEAEMHQFGFFRPYAEDKGGVSCEPWHISYAPIATVAKELFTERTLFEVVKESNLFGREWILANLENLYARYIINITLPPKL